MIRKRQNWGKRLQKGKNLTLDRQKKKIYCRNEKKEKKILERKRPESRKAKRRTNTLDRKILDSSKIRKKHFL